MTHAITGRHSAVEARELVDEIGVTRAIHYTHKIRDLETWNWGYWMAVENEVHGLFKAAA